MVEQEFHGYETWNLQVRLAHRRKTHEHFIFGFSVLDKIFRAEFQCTVG